MPPPNDKRHLEKNLRGHFVVQGTRGIRLSIPPNPTFVQSFKPWGLLPTNAQILGNFSLGLGLGCKSLRLMHFELTPKGTNRDYKGMQQLTIKKKLFRTQSIPDRIPNIVLNITSQ